MPSFGEQLAFLHKRLQNPMGWHNFMRRKSAQRASWQHSLELSEYLPSVSRSTIWRSQIGNVHFAEERVSVRRTSVWTSAWNGSSSKVCQCLNGLTLQFCTMIFQTFPKETKCSWFNLRQRKAPSDPWWTQRVVLETDSWLARHSNLGLHHCRVQSIVGWCFIVFCSWKTWLRFEKPNQESVVINTCTFGAMSFYLFS